MFLITLLSILLEYFHFILITYCTSCGLVHSKLCNHLGIEKAGKLVFLFKKTTGY